MKKLLVLFLTIISFQLTAQPPTVQDCLGAIPVCQQIYFEDQAFSGDGNYNSEINTSISCTAGELNSIWYTFTVDNSGDFGFVITPNNYDDDYDWALFDITNANCEDIFTDASLSVSCNASGGFGCHGPTGATGDTNWDVQGAGCNSSPPSQFAGFSTFNDLVPVIEGNTYVLMVSNWTGSQFGYTIDFGLGSGIGIIDEESPDFVDFVFPTECGDNTIEFTLNEFIQCATIETSDIVLTGPGGPYTVTISSTGCDAGGDFDKEFILTVDPPFTSPGLYNLAFQVDESTDMLDLCDNPTNAIDFDFNFDPPISLNVDLGDSEQGICDGQTLTLDATNPGATYVWQDGSMNPTFIVDQAGTYSVTVSNSCGSVSDTVEVSVVIDPPVFDLGMNLTLCEGDELMLDATSPFSTYLWSNAATDPTIDIQQGGTYTVTVTNACGSNTDDIFIDFIPAVVLELGDDLAFCEGDTVVLDASVSGGVYEWQNGQTTPTLTVTEAGTYSVAVETECQSLSDEIFINFITDDPLNLGPDTILCANDTLTLDVTIAGATYEWEDFTTNPIKNIIEDGFYAVTISTECKIFEDDISVIFLPEIDYNIGEDTYLCDNQIFLDAATNGFALYRWQDGSELPFYVVDETGTYSVTVFNQCEEITQTIEVVDCEHCDVYWPNVFSPDFDGVNDKFFPMSDCPIDNYSMQIYNRWGALVFSTNDPSDGWDGTYRGQEANMGTYIWRSRFTVIENDIQRSVEASGDITILRQSVGLILKALFLKSRVL